MKDDIFRKVSLERISSPEQLDQTMTVTSPRSLLSLFAIGLLLVGIFIWGIFGTISTRINGRGVLMKSGGVRNIVHLSEGIITDVRIVPGDIVSPGDIIARVERREQINEILELEQYMETLMGSHDPAVQQEYAEMTGVLQMLRENLAYDSFIVSPYKGRVLEVKLNKGDILVPDISIASIELIGDGIKELEGIIYVDADQGKNIYNGMEVKISPSNVKKEEYGFLLGTVVSVSEYPTTRQGMLSVLGSEEMVQRLMEDSSPIEVKVDLTPDGESYSGYKWTSPQGPPIKINSGTLCQALVTVESVAPIKKVLPIR